MHVNESKTHADPPRSRGVARHTSNTNCALDYRDRRKIDRGQVWQISPVVATRKAGKIGLIERFVVRPVFRVFVIREEEASLACEIFIERSVGRLGGIA